MIRDAAKGPSASENCNFSYHRPPNAGGTLSGDHLPLWSHVAVAACFFAAFVAAALWLPQDQPTIRRHIVAAVLDGTFNTRPATARSAPRSSRGTRSIARLPT